MVHTFVDMSCVMLMNTKGVICIPYAITEEVIR